MVGGGVHVGVALVDSVSFKVMFVPMVNSPDFDPLDLGGDEATWLVFNDRSEVLLVDGQIPQGAIPPVGSTNVHLLGKDGEQPVLAARLDPESNWPDDATWANLRHLYGAVSEGEWVMAGRAVQILDWDRDHQFCGRCGEPTGHHGRDRARECAKCKLLAYPRVTPAIIVLVERSDGHALLAWGRQFPGRFYSALAGFVEPGETFEQAVGREVGEEVGVEVGNVSYFGSQPWPFPNSVMIGFNADYTGGDIVIDETEIVEADWFKPDALPPVPRGGMSIAGWLIEDWLRRTA